MVKPIREQLLEDEIVAQFLKMTIDNGNDWPSHFLQSQDVYCKNPSTLFNTQEPLTLHDGRYFFVYRTVNSGKTDGCEAGCWRVMGGDKLIKSKKIEKDEILGFKKILKFCEKVQLSEDDLSWVMGGDKLIKSEKNEKIEILGFKKVYKFCEKEKPRSICKWIEMEKRQARDKRIWVMEEYRLASQWKQGYVIVKIQLLNPNPLEFLLCNHIRGYYK